MRLHALLLCGLLGLGCRRPSAARPWVPEATPALGAVVARVGDVPIFATEVARQAAGSGKSPRAALDELVGLHLLAERVRGQWPPQDHDPQARRLEREMLVQRLLERDFEAHTRPEDMPDAAVKVLYDGAHDSFVHPHLVDVAVLAGTPGKRATPEKRAQFKQTMTELLALVNLQRERTADALQALAADEKWRDRGVQYFRFLQAGDKPYSAKFGAIVDKMKTVGETSGLIEDQYGFYIARYMGDRPPANQTFEQVKQELREGYYQRWRQAKFLEFTQQLAGQHEVEIHAGALAAAPGS